MTDIVIAVYNIIRVCMASKLLLQAGSKFMKSNGEADQPFWLACVVAMGFYIHYCYHPIGFEEWLFKNSFNLFILFNLARLAIDYQVIKLGITMGKSTK